MPFTMKHEREPTPFVKMCWFLFVALVLQIDTASGGVPTVTSVNPPSRKFNAPPGTVIYLALSYSANPGLSSTNVEWTIVTSKGSRLTNRNLANAGVGSYTNPYLQFALSSTDYYGNYSYTLTNADGSTTVTFQVLAPDRPDAPANFYVAFLLPYGLQLRWNCMWSNYNYKSQDIYTVLKEYGSNSIVRAVKVILDGSCFNTNYFVTLLDNIRPDTYYVASVNSTNDMGTSPTVSGLVKTPKPIQLYVDSDTIQVKYPLATIYFEIINDNASVVYYMCIACTFEAGAQSTSSCLNVTSSFTQTTMSLASIKNATEYVFDVQLNIYNPIYGTIGATTKRGIRVNAPYATTGVPNVTSVNPPSRIFNGLPGTLIFLGISYSANSFLTSTKVEWTIVTTKGSRLTNLNLAGLQNYGIGGYRNPYLQFTLPSTDYYGNYSYTLTNAQGSTTVTFQVLAPGQPDSPSYFQALYVVPYGMQLRWNCGWSNYNERSQIMRLVLKEFGNNSTVGLFNVTQSGICFSSSYSANFQYNIKPDTYYMASVNSTNDLGTSSTVSILVKTPKPIQLIVDSDTIQVQYPQASIYFQINNYDASVVYYMCIVCTFEAGAQSATSCFFVSNSFAQATMSIASIQNAIEYVFDVQLYIYNPNYGAIAAATKRGIRVKP